MKAWQQLIQSQTPNGLTAPSLGGAGATATPPTTTANNKSEQSSPSDGQQQQRSNVADSRQRRKSVSSTSREGTPSQLSTESLAGKSSSRPPPPPAPAVIGGTHGQTNTTSRTPTPTPSPRPPNTPTSSSSSTSSPSGSQVPPLPPPPPSSVPSSAPQPAPVIPRPTKAQDFARNRIRRMQMLAQVGPQSHKPSQITVPTSSMTTTSSSSDEQLPKSQEVNKSQPCQLQSEVANYSQSLSSQLQAPAATSTDSVHNSSSVKATTVAPNSNSVLNGSNFKVVATAAVSDSKSFLAYSNSSQSSSSNKFMNAHSRSTPSLSQIVTNSFNHDSPLPPSLPPPPISVSSSLDESRFSSAAPSFSNTATSALSTAIAHKIEVKSSQESSVSSHKQVIEDTPSPPESLLVRIPRNLVHISRRNHEFHEAKGPHYDDFRTDWLGQGLHVASNREEFSLMVSIDLSLLHPFSNSQEAIGGAMKDIRQNRTEHLMKGHDVGKNSDLSMYKFGDVGEPIPMETETFTSFGSGGIPHVPTSFTSSGHFSSFGSDEGIPYNVHLPATPGPQLVPSGASPGVDGCMGSDGYWYSWTDSIPGHDVSVTVLPYIYVDDDDSDVMEIFTN